MTGKTLALVALVYCATAATPSAPPSSPPGWPAPRLAQEEAQVDAICKQHGLGHGLNAYPDPRFPLSLLEVRIQCEGGQLEQQWSIIRFPAPRPTRRPPTLH